MLIGVVPVGDIPELASQVVAAHISGYLNLPVQICQPLEHPAYAFDERRLQYNAAAILKSTNVTTGYCAAHSRNFSSNRR